MIYDMTLHMHLLPLYLEETWAKKGGTNAKRWLAARFQGLLGTRREAMSGQQELERDVQPDPLKQELSLV